MTRYDDIASYARLLEGWERTLENSGMPGADGVSEGVDLYRLHDRSL